MAAFWNPTRRGDGDRPRPAADHHPGRDHGRGVPIPGARAGRFWLSEAGVRASALASGESVALDHVAPLVAPLAAVRWTVSVRGRGVSAAGWPCRVLGTTGSSSKEP